jgi:hypothetical protein
MLPPWRRQPPPPPRFPRLTIGLVADELTRSCLAPECHLVDLTPRNFARRLRERRPDLLFVESAWRGLDDSWKFRIASYPDHPERTNADLVRLVEDARALGIPAVFWNKEDGLHFERFIGSARLFDRIFTVDAGCIERYRARLGPQQHVELLPFAVQPSIHGFLGIGERRPDACFVGTYDTNIHPARLVRQEMLLRTAAAVMGLTAINRNSDRRGPNFRFPPWPGLREEKRIPHEQTADVYRSHLVSLNVNTIEDSPTMFSRRLIEILASGGLAVTTPAASVEAMFPGCCHVVATEDEARPLFERLHRHGYDARDREMIERAAHLVHGRHTYAQRIRQVLAAVGLDRLA